MLTNEIANYVRDLKSEFPSITDVWLFGSRANGTTRDDSDWDFLVFSTSPIYEKIKNNAVFHRDDVDLLLVGKDGEFSKPFGQPKGGSLKRWKWNQVSVDLARYEGCKWIPDEDAAAEGMENIGDLVCQILNAHRV